MSEWKSTCLTWDSAVEHFVQGTGGVYLARIDGGKVVAGKIPWWVHIASSMAGYTLPTRGVVCIRAALKIPPKKSWAVGMVQLGYREVRYRRTPCGSVEFEGGVLFGPLGERSRLQSCIADGLDIHPE